MRWRFLLKLQYWLLKSKLQTANYCDACSYIELINKNKSVSKEYSHFVLMILSYFMHNKKITDIQIKALKRISKIGR